MNVVSLIKLVNVLYLKAENPSGSSLNALGLYLISCLIFVVGALAEFSIVVVISRSSGSASRRSEELRKNPNVENANELMASGNQRICWNNDENVSAATDNERATGPLPSSAQRLIDYMKLHINTIDLSAFFVYLCLFVMFNCIYWAKYL